MGTILNNYDAEALLLDIRAGRQAGRTVIDGGSGAFIVFPTAVIIDRPGGGQLVFPVRTDVEPGWLCQRAGHSTVAAMVDGTEVQGQFAWAITDGAGEAEPPPASYHFLVDGRCVPEPAWACQLPRSVSVRRRTAAELLRDRNRLVRQGRIAEHWLLVLSQRVMKATCRGPLGRVLATHRLVTSDDVVQRGLQAANRLLAVYASPNRPPRSWVGMIQLDAKRDMHRGVSELDWLPRELSEVVDRARAAGIGLHGDPALTLAALIDASLEAGQPLPRVSARQVRTALSTPEVVSLDAPIGRGEGWQPQEGGITAPDPALEAVDDQRGWAAAAIARLVADDQETVVRAFLGDPAALKVVADRVLVTLGRAGEGPAATRRRCRSEFLATGELLSAEAAGGRFPGAALSDLAALDAALRAAVGFDIAGRPAEPGGHSPPAVGGHRAPSAQPDPGETTA